MKPRKPIKAVPLTFLLGNSQADLDSFELARLADVANLRRELHEVLESMVDAMAQAALASWFSRQDRQSLKDAIENEKNPIEWAKRMLRSAAGSRAQKHHKPAEREQLLARYRSTQLLPEQFAQQHDLKPETLQRWLREERKAGPKPKGGSLAVVLRHAGAQQGKDIERARRKKGQQ